MVGATVVGWRAADIRRHLPEYCARPGDDVKQGPYRAAEADLDAFVLEADAAALRGLVQAQLTSLVSSPALVGSQLELAFDCTAPWVVLIFASFGALSSTDPAARSEGSVSAQELSVWVPIVKRQRVARSWLEQAAWFLPLVYTAPTAAVATGREVFGYPKLPARFVAAADGIPAVVAVASGEVVRISAASGSEAVKPLPASAAALRGFVARFVADTPVVFRKQAGVHLFEGSIRAGYSALIEGRLSLKNILHLEAIPKVQQSGQLEVLHPQLREVLGVAGSHALEGMRVRGSILDTHAATEIWVASKPRALVEPVRAPGDELLRHPQPPARSARPLLDIRAVSSQVYLAHSSSSAVAALLARHFPASAARPRPDGSRPYVVLHRLHASLDTPDARLDELSVLVPVLQGAERAWYVPQMYRSPGTAVIQARETFGHPCRQASFRVPPGETRLRVGTAHPVVSETGAVRWQEQDILELERLPRPDEEDQDDEGHRALREWLDGEQRLVGLLQTRHAADSSRACFQAIVSSTRNVQLDGRVRIRGRLRLLAELELGGLLDLDDELAGYELSGLRLGSTLPVIQELFS